MVFLTFILLVFPDVQIAIYFMNLADVYDFCFSALPRGVARPSHSEERQLVCTDALRVWQPPAGQDVHADTAGDRTAAAAHRSEDAPRTHTTRGRR